MPLAKEGLWALEAHWARSHGGPGRRLPHQKNKNWLASNLRRIINPPACGVVLEVSVAYGSHFAPDPQPFPRTILCHFCYNIPQGSAAGTGLGPDLDPTARTSREDFK